MKSISAALLLGFAATEVLGHATFQQLWVDGVDFGGQCARAPQSNTPVTNVAGRDVICNVGGLRGVGGKCPVPAGSTVTIEMHQQPGDRACNKEAIGGQHYGPVMVYLTKVADAATADGSTGWFKIFEDGWNSAGPTGGEDFWGAKDLNDCCGRMDVPIPVELEDGDYLLRAEVIALHVAGQPSGAQLYMTCYQITVTGGAGTLSPPQTVRFPGAYSARDPGILFNIHAKVNEYVVPGPPVIPEGATKDAGSACTGCEGTCKPGGPSGTVEIAVPTAGVGGVGGGGGCAQAAYQQCGGTGYSGCTSCATGRCVQVNPYYHQCQG